MGIITYAKQKPEIVEKSRFTLIHQIICAKVMLFVLFQISPIFTISVIKQKSRRRKRGLIQDISSPSVLYWRILLCLELLRAFLFCGTIM